MYSITHSFSLYVFPVAINHCADNTHSCHSNANCFYLGPGKHNCTCAAGYTGDGTVCAGKLTLLCYITMDIFTHDFFCHAKLGFLVLFIKTKIHLHKFIILNLVNM